MMSRGIFECPLGLLHRIHCEYHGDDGFCVVRIEKVAPLDYVGSHGGGSQNEEEKGKETKQQHRGFQRGPPP